MKKLFKAIAALLSAAVITVTIPVTAFAGSISGAKDSTVYIRAYFNSDDSHPYVFDFGSGYEFSSALSEGSGFAIGNVGENVEYIVTNAHVVLDDTAACVKSGYPLGQTLSASSLRANDVEVYFSKAANEFMHAKIEMVDEEKDICVLKLPQATDKKVPLVICKSSDINEDDTFAALGFPSKATRYQEATDVTKDTSDIVTTRGGISGKSTNADGVDVYRIDMDISAGNSGGPLVNSNGEVVGINTYSVGDMNYAIVIDELLSIINRDMIPYTLSSEVNEASDSSGNDSNASEAAPVSANSFNATPIIIIAAVVIAAAAVVAVVAILKKKSGGAPVQAYGAAPAQTPGKAVINGMKGIMAGRSFDINGSIVLGRNPQKCNVSFPVDSKGISGVHCQIRQTNGGYEIIDCGSSNGTYLGSGQKLIPNVPVFLPSGTYFYLGSAEQLFRITY